MKEEEYAYRVECKKHKYDTLRTLTKTAALVAARMHALYPCSEVVVTDKDNNIIDWRNRDNG
jgi:hypothetical protein